jgi:hypothetical protein
MNVEYPDQPGEEDPRENYAEENTPVDTTNDGDLSDLFAEPADTGGSAQQSDTVDTQPDDGLDDLFTDAAGDPTLNEVADPASPTHIGDLADLVADENKDSASVLATATDTDESVDDLLDLFDSSIDGQMASHDKAEDDPGAGDEIADLFGQEASVAIPSSGGDKPAAGGGDDLSDLVSNLDGGDGKQLIDTNPPITEAESLESAAEVADAAEPNSEIDGLETLDDLADLFSDPIGSTAGDIAGASSSTHNESVAPLANAIGDEPSLDSTQHHEISPELATDLQPESPVGAFDSQALKLDEPDPDAVAINNGAADAIEPQQVSSEGAELFNLGKEVDGGRAFFEAGDPTGQAADRLGEFPGTRKYDMHGDPEHVYIDGKPLTAAQFADVVRSDPNWHGEPITLFACETGKQPEGGGAPFAQQLSDELGVEVFAPTELAWSNGAPCYASAEQDAQGNSRPKNPPDGELKSFQPATGEQAASGSERRQVDDDRQADTLRPIGGINPEPSDTPLGDQPDATSSPTASSPSETTPPAEDQDGKAAVEPDVEVPEVNVGDLTPGQSAEPVDALPTNAEALSQSETSSSGELAETVASDTPQVISRRRISLGSGDSGLDPVEAEPWHLSWADADVVKGNRDVLLAELDQKIEALADPELQALARQLRDDPRCHMLERHEGQVTGDLLAARTLYEVDPDTAGGPHSAGVPTNTAFRSLETQLTCWRDINSSQWVDERSGSGIGLQELCGQQTIDGQRATIDFDAEELLGDRLGQEVLAIGVEPVLDGPTTKSKYRKLREAWIKHGLSAEIEGRPVLVRQCDPAGVNEVPVVRVIMDLTSDGWKPVTMYPAGGDRNEVTRRKGSDA